MNALSVEGTVYIVDDDPAVCRSISLMVEAMRLATETYNTAEQFLECVSEESHGCLITDVRMLGMSGVELLKKLSESNIQLPAIVISAYADVKLTLEVMRAGAMTLVEKPYRDQELWDAIVEAMRIGEASYRIRSQHLICKQRLSQLTKDEVHVLKAMARGLCSQTPSHNWSAPMASASPVAAAMRSCATPRPCHSWET